MSEFRFRTGIQAGSAALAAEREAKEVAAELMRPTSRHIRAGSEAMDAEYRSRREAEHPAKPTGFSLRAQEGRVARVATAPAALVTDKVCETAEPDETRSLSKSGEQFCSTPDEMSPPPDVIGAGTRHSPPGRLHAAAAQLKSRIRAIFHDSASS